MNGLHQSVTVDRRARLLRLGALIAAAVMLSLAAFSTSAGAAASKLSKQPPKPTIVLVHGAFASPAGWEGVVDALHKDGYQTATPTLGLASVAEDVAIVQSTLDSIPGRQDPGRTLLRRVRDHQRRYRPGRRPRTRLHGCVRPRER